MWDESQLYHNSLPVHKQHEVLSLQSQIEAITNEIAILQVCFVYYSVFIQQIFRTPPLVYKDGRSENSFF